MQSEVESDKSDKGLYETGDDDGLSYYYHGSVSNNYVKFEGFYWQIIRINGDGSVRLMYAGSDGSSEGRDRLSATNRAFNTKRDNPTYNGYMYSNTLNESYEKITQNEISSNVKSVLDTWYQNNILNTPNEVYLVDAGFCSDRSLYLGNVYTDSEETTYYAAYNRYYNTKTPTLKCSKKNDLLTLSTSNKGE